MAWTTAPVFVTGEITTAARLNILSDDVTFLHDPPTVHLTRSAFFTVANNTSTAITFDVERIDTDNMHSTSSNIERINITTSGFYYFTGQATWAANATGHRSLGLRMSGATFASVVSQMAVTTASEGTAQCVSTLRYIVAGANYMELVAAQSSGGALNIEKDSDYSAEFMAFWVRG